ncbi:hypothetical protein [Rhodococcus sp. NPDC058521]|uniref:hypothetical protein n=1 Tax=Rhodococcus sp. NPDC058521 TaxID=3346536 RepID=UPI00365EB333
MNALTIQILAQADPSGPEFGKASPFGLLVLLALFVGVVLLVRSMNKRLSRLPDKFEPEHPEADQEADEGTDRGAIPHTPQTPPDKTD